MALQTEPSEAEGRQSTGTRQAQAERDVVAPCPRPVETHPSLLPGGKDLSFQFGLCQQPLLRSVFLAALFLCTGNNPINSIISAEEGQGYMKFNELSSLLKGNRRVEELTALWETLSERGPAQPSSTLSAGKSAAAPGRGPQPLRAATSSLRASVSLVIHRWGGIGTVDE